MEVLHDLNKQERISGVNLKLNDTIRTLGLVWDPNTDMFTAKFHKEVYSKRELLSEISKLFDPLGLLGPIITLAKLLMQETWKENIDWDHELPANILNRWNKLKNE